MPRITRATRAQIERKAEEQGSDGYSDSDCDSVVEPRARAALDHTLGGARTGAPATAVIIDAAEELRARRGAALDHTFGEAQTRRAIPSDCYPL
ncbi:hypothetical protein HF086_001137 [Spodoptera exigua]|uniref:Uncharacterized protein n=1 Tax=Spodoptera exigua TaxID=7107 RepID=A0A922M297_SPOEX|nr:hypothetical protein HF086_001137 [Spodoptera exigua]